MALLHLNGETFDGAVGKGVVLADFFAPWCGPCQMVGPVIAGLAERYEGRAAVAKVNVDESPEIAARFGVELIPTVVLLKNGAEVSRKVGVADAAEYAAMIDANL